MDEENAKLAVTERILEQLALIDKAKDNGELQTAIQNMLQFIGVYIKADRAFVFEKKMRQAVFLKIRLNGVRTE